MSSARPLITKMTQGSPPCGAAVRLLFAFAGLNFPINAMVSPWFGEHAKIKGNAENRGAAISPRSAGGSLRVPRTSVERLEVASYEGPGKLEARVYALTSPEVGVDLAQRWRPSADTVFF